MSRVKPLSLSTLLEQHVLLPSQPRAVALLSSELRKPEPGMRSLVQLFSTDPVLTARLLAAANGPAPAGPACAQHSRSAGASGAGSVAADGAEGGPCQRVSCLGGLESGWLLAL